MADESPHVMVIDDTPELLALFEAALAGEGYRVTTDRFTVEPDRLLGRVEAAAPDALVLDFLILGEPVGWQFLQMLKLHPPTAGIPVVVCTAAVRLVEELRPHLEAMGVGVVIKPFDLDHLLAAVAAALRRGDGDRGAAG